MQSRGKLGESAYFLEEMRRTSSNPMNFNYNFSAFMSATHSVMDILLYDFAEKYGLFARDDRFGRDRFLSRADAQKNTEAKEFLRWWDGKKRSLAANPLWEKRHRIVHRENPSVERDFSVYVSGATSNPTSNSYDVASAVARRVMAAQPPFAGIKHVRGMTPSPKIFLSTMPDADLRDSCRQLYGEMDRIVNEAETTFWIG